jgi:hypothetical protein
MYDAGQCKAATFKAEVAIKGALIEVMMTWSLSCRLRVRRKSNSPERPRFVVVLDKLDPVGMFPLHCVDLRHNASRKASAPFVLDQYGGAHQKFAGHLHGCAMPVQIGRVSCQREQSFGVVFRRQSDERIEGDTAASAF